MNTNPFGGRRLYINSIDDAMYSADKKWYVTYTTHLKSYGGETYPKLNPAWVSEYVYTGGPTVFNVTGSPNHNLDIAINTITPTPYPIKRDGHNSPSYADTIYFTDDINKYDIGIPINEVIN
jgi:hypothetical protein